ncbi:membrane-bound lytic murein transglycosylase B- like protein [Segniliparus rotundus DSM 44985]|uniref:Membrane-bound lytic murein transglycosylase B-like protein n=1 Tax=Segniliparus rotundus (strain ATCC BAA-972 / CDC 1076 / CIP 108378 / DSM 44985 / JCM 13578) TaxID=640132 RepID=D6ZFJ8_SEGRD|nr:murein transglycosylase [Segniliparus rotundus]ADG97722.1 membrane-bound lytic murein transglycosylase B- like protein [Segniliparus rotundus DSM 44985]
MTELRESELRTPRRAEPADMAARPQRRRWLWPAALCAGLIVVVALAYVSSTNEPQLIEVTPPPAGDEVPDLFGPNPRTPTAQLFAAWAEPISRRTRIPKRALMAYANAIVLSRQNDPGCGIAWTTLAGIASKESSNGAHGNAAIAPNGDVRPRIRGHALDGTDGTPKMVDTYEQPNPDGAPVYVRAKGPFQFIPETWDRNKTDGNADGVYDPDNIDDAAATAAHYLCSRGGDMTTPQGWRDALRAYNDSPVYLLDVRKRAAVYANGIGF